MKKRLDKYSILFVYSGMKNERKIMSKEKKLKSLNIQVKMDGMLPKHYEAYLYKITLTRKNKVLGYYVGYHKGKFVFGQYWCSSTSKKEKGKRFRRLLRDVTVHMEYEILDTGTEAKMTVEEYAILKMNEVTRNDEWFNDSYGSPKYKPISDKKINAMVKNIHGGKYETTMVSAEKVYNEYDKKQVREKENDTQMDLQEIVDDNVGRLDRVDLWTAIVIVEIEPDVFILVDGNTRVSAVYFSKHGDKLPAIVIPYEEIKDWTSSELHVLGNALNPVSEDRSKEMTKEDAVKELLELKKTDNIDIDDDNNFTRLEDRFFSSTKAKNIIAKAMKEWDKVQRAKGTWIDWTSQGWKPILNPMIQELDDDGKVVVGPMTTGKYNQESITKKRNLDKTSEVVVLFHHPDPDSMDAWENKIEKEKILELNELIGNGSKTVTKFKFLTLPYDRPTNLVSPDKFWNTDEGKYFLTKNSLSFNNV